MGHDKLIRLPQVEFLAGIKCSQVYGLIAKGAFPPPAKIGSTSRWSQIEVCAWRDRYPKRRPRRETGTVDE